MTEVITRARRKRTPEENARREKIRELLQLANVGSMDDIQELFKDTIAEFMENGLEAELFDMDEPEKLAHAFAAMLPETAAARRANTAMADFLKAHI